MMEASIREHVQLSFIDRSQGVPIMGPFGPLYGHFRENNHTSSKK